MLLYKALPRVYGSPSITPQFPPPLTTHHEALRLHTPRHALPRLLRAHRPTPANTAQHPLRRRSRGHARITEHPHRRRHRVRPRSVPALDHAERDVQVLSPPSPPLLAVYIYIYVSLLTPNTLSTREVVLQRDGINVVQSSSCAATSGSWFSPYDGATWTDAADVVCMPPPVAAATAAADVTERAGYRPYGPAVGRVEVRRWSLGSLSP